MWLSAQRAGYLLSRLDALLDGDTGRVWLRSMIHRQQSQPWKEIKCGTPPEPLHRRVTRFRREWTSVLREIASACPLMAESCEVLLQLDPLSKESVSAIELHAAQIRRVLSDPGLARSLYRERDRKAFGSQVKARRRGLGWSLRRLARESADAARRIGFGVRAPDRYQLMDYEAGRSNAHPMTKRVLALALGVSVDDLEAAPSVPLKVPAHQPLAVKSSLPCAPPYQTGIFIIENPDEYFRSLRRSKSAA